MPAARDPADAATAVSSAPRASPRRGLPTLPFPPYEGDVPRSIHNRRAVMTSQLFSPISLRGLTLPNRIVVSPMCEYSAENGSATDWHLAHLGQLSLSGPGLLITEAAAVEARGRITHYDLGQIGRAHV